MSRHIQPKFTISGPKAYFIFKIALAAFCLLFLIYKISDLNLNTLSALLISSFALRWPLLLLAVALVFLNWSLETIKWQYLIKKIELIPFLKAYSAIMTGLALSMLTPYRVGEFAGRLLHLKNKLDSRIVALTMVGNMSQFFMTLLLGLPGFYYVVNRYNPYFFESKYGLTVGLFLAPLFYFIVFLKTPGILARLRDYVAGNKLLLKFSEAGAMLSKVDLLKVSALSLLRYLVFAFQYYLIFYFFNIELPFVKALLVIPAIFFIQSVIPSFAVADLGIRTTVSVWVFGNLLPIDYGGIIAASTMLWFINLLLPSIWGLMALLKTKINP